MVVRPIFDEGFFRHSTPVEIGSIPTLTAAFSSGVRDRGVKLREEVLGNEKVSLVSSTVSNN
jgi:hypothetical protein